MSLISAITARGHMRFMIKEKGGVNAAVFIEFLKRLMAGAKRAGDITFAPRLCTLLQRACAIGRRRPAGAVQNLSHI
jgi:hypothetical protein